MLSTSFTTIFFSGYIVWALLPKGLCIGPALYHIKIVPNELIAGVNAVQPPTFSILSLTCPLPSPPPIKS